ncbi:hypothetical protein [uncultured Chryseobacterium sp.]|uniref:hypothetical protein n=1 Tax=uncultured Chryseobacterium sp. TaxID=259322 RepID=UPI0025852216|nr:hypothetical protein [uncultured Chryseobacterium sp.]
MKSKEFLKNCLQELACKYSNSTIKYYFDTFDNDHYVMIAPESDLQNIMQNDAVDIDREFIAKFPYESISFINENDTLSFDELVFYHLPFVKMITTKVEEQDKRVVNFNITNFLSRNFRVHNKMEYREPLFRSKKVDSSPMPFAGNEEYALAA